MNKKILGEKLNNNVLVPFTATVADRVKKIASLNGLRTTTICRLLILQALDELEKGKPLILQGLVEESEEAQQTQLQQAVYKNGQNQEKARLAEEEARLKEVVRQTAAHSSRRRLNAPKPALHLVIELSEWFKSLKVGETFTNAYISEIVGEERPASGWSSRVTNIISRAKIIAEDQGVLLYPVNKVGYRRHE